MKRVLIIASLLVVEHAWADKIPAHLQKAYEEGTQNAIMIGKIAPTSVMRELNAAAAELKAARLAVKAEVAKGCRDYNGVQERIWLLEAKATELLSKADKKFKTLAADIGKLRIDIDTLRKEVIFLSTAAAAHLAMAFDTLKGLDARVMTLEKKAEKQWGIGLQVVASYDYNTGKENFAQFNTIGIEGYFLSKVLLASVSVGGGINALNPGFAWAFALNGEYRITPQISIGGTVGLAQDMNDMQGAVKTVPSIGPVIRYMQLGDAFKSWAITLSPIKIGPQGNKGVAGGKPSWDFDLGGSITLSWFVL